MPWSTLCSTGSATTMRWTGTWARTAFGGLSRRGGRRAAAPGAVLSGSGGDVHLKLSDAPVTTRFVRVLMSKSSGTCDSHGAQDIRNCVGYALQTLSVGTIEAAGHYAVAYPANGVEPGPGAPPRLEGARDQEVIAGSPADLGGSFFGSSLDHWHQADNLITGGS